MVRKCVPSIQTAFLMLRGMHSEIDTVKSYSFCMGSYLKCQEEKSVIRRKGPTVPEWREYIIRHLVSLQSTSTLFFSLLLITYAWATYKYMGTTIKKV